MPSARLALPPLTISGLPARIVCWRRRARMSGYQKDKWGIPRWDHLTIGAGRVVKQSLLRIADAIADVKSKGRRPCAT
jgi:hypothetical protein